MPGLTVAALLAAVAWVYLLTGHGGYWRTGPRLPTATGGQDPGPLPHVVAVIPARDEAAILPGTLPSLLAQQYPGEFSVVLVDDGSSDGTAAVATKIAAELAAAGQCPHRLRVIHGSPPPGGWAGKVWAMAQGVAAAGECDYLLFTDADIAFGETALSALVRAAVTDDRALVSQMALLRADTGWERWIVPAFVYFFAQLYPFRRVGRAHARTAAAAGGCMLVRRGVLESAGGLELIRDARIDDIALARLLKRPPVSARCWLGFTREVRSRRPYPRLADLWGMVARSAYTQLRYSPWVLVAVIAGLALLYLVPPAATVAGVAAIAGGGGPAGGSGAGAAWCAGAGVAGWATIALTYLPVLRLYGLSPLRALGLPAAAALYAAMTVSSAWRHHAGRGGEWTGRMITFGSS